MRLGGVENFILQSTLNLHPAPYPTFEMPYNDDDASTDESTQASLESRAPSSWKTVWTNNKGVVFIVLAQAVGSSMDAIVRFLQQGGHRMHPFQVSEHFGVSGKSC